MFPIRESLINSNRPRFGKFTCASEKCSILSFIFSNTLKPKVYMKSIKLHTLWNDYMEYSIHPIHIFVSFFTWCLFNPWGDSGEEFLATPL